MTHRNERKKKSKYRKRIKLRNKKLVKKYPWIAPKFNPWTGRLFKQKYNYSYTWRDDIPKGWDIAFGDLMLGDIDAELRRAGLVNDFTFEEIKEKFGALRAYFDGGNDAVDHIIDTYSHISEHVCIGCGKPDVPVTNAGWILPLCKDCFEKHVNTKHSYGEVICTDDDGKIVDSYTIRRFTPDGQSKDFVYDISDTVQKVRSNYERRIRRVFNESL